MDKQTMESLEPPVPEEEIKAAEEPAAEAKPPDEAKPVEQEKEKEKVVPLAALHEARAQKKELQAELARFREEQAARNATLEQRLAALYQAQQQREQQPAPVFEERPLEHLKSSLDQVMQNQQSVHQELARQQENERAAGYRAQLAHVVTSAENAFKAETPDYPEALEYVRAGRIAQLRALGYNDMEAGQYVLNEAIGVAQRCIQAGKNPAEAIYEMAKATGYQPKARQQAPAPTPTEKLQTIQKGVEAAKTLGGGGASAGTPTVDQIANMSEEEFADFMKKGGGKILKQQLQ